MSSEQRTVPPGVPPHLPPELAGHPRYHILRELGRGGMGVVYQARQTVMNRQVVIKVISRALLDHPDAVERFRREVQAAARLSHPNIVTAYDAEQSGERLREQSLPGCEAVGVGDCQDVAARAGQRPWSNCGQRRPVKRA